MQASSEDSHATVACPSCGEANAEYNPRCSRCGAPLSQDSRQGGNGDGAPDRDAARLGSAIAGYRLHEKLGCGGMGVVYRAQELQSGRPAALKLLDPRLTREPQSRARFLRE